MRKTVVSNQSEIVEYVQDSHFEVYVIMVCMYGVSLYWYALGNHFLSHRTVPFIMFPFYLLFTCFVPKSKGGGKEELGMKLGTHMQIMDIGSLGIKNVLNNLGCRREYTSTATNAVNKTHTQSTLLSIIKYTSAYISLPLTRYILYFFNQTLQLVFLSLLIFVQLLFEGAIYFFGKPTDTNDGMYE